MWRVTWTREELARRNDDQVAEISERVLNRFAKWRSVFAGWQLGTRLATDPESRALRDHREITMLLRAEVSALTALLVEAGVTTPRAFTEHVILEAENLETGYERRFPGMKATDDGITYALPEATETMKDWLP